MFFAKREKEKKEMLSGDGGGGQRDLPSIYPFFDDAVPLQQRKIMQGKITIFAGAVAGSTAH